MLVNTLVAYPWKTPPFAHQREWWEKSRDLKAFAVFWEQGTGKSKLTIDSAAWLHLRGEIDAVLIIAPNGVHRNWVVNEIPTHLPDSVSHHSFLWLTRKAKQAAFKTEMKRAMAAPGLLIVAMSYDGIMTKAGDAFALQLLTSRRCLMVLDESARIKNPKAKRTIRVQARGKAAKFKRILTGTPVANSPFDVFSQLTFLNPAIWNPIGCRSYVAFKNYFGVWRDMKDPRSGRMFRDLVRYRNLEVLGRLCQSIGSRLLKTDVLKDLPPKLYTKRYFTLTPDQAAVYQSMKDSFEIRYDAGQVTAMLVIVQLLRFQQIVSGFMVDDEDRIIELAENPRLELLREIVGDTPGKMIVFAKFRHDIDVILKALREDGVEAVRYDGETSPDKRAEAIDRFQDGTARAFVANPAAAGEGLTLHAATTVIYYNNSFKLTDRLQSEDRAHRIGQKSAVTYIDIVAEDTVDEKIVDALRGKLDVASIITGDKLKAWI